MCEGGAPPRLPGLLGEPAERWGRLGPTCGTRAESPKVEGLHPRVGECGGHLLFVSCTVLFPILCRYTTNIKDAISTSVAVETACTHSAYQLSVLSEHSQVDGEGRPLGASTTGGAEVGLGLGLLAPPLGACKPFESTVSSLLHSQWALQRGSPQSGQFLLSTTGPPCLFLALLHFSLLPYTPTHFFPLLPVPPCLLLLPVPMPAKRHEGNSSANFCLEPALERREEQGDMHMRMHSMLVWADEHIENIIYS